MRVKLDLKDIKYSDLEAINNDIWSKEIYTAYDLDKLLDVFVYDSWGTCVKYIKMVYLFKLGVMIGKREERARKKRINTKVS